MNKLILVRYTIMHDTIAAIIFCVTVTLYIRVSYKAYVTITELVNHRTITGIFIKLRFIYFFMNFDRFQSIQEH